MTLVDFQLHWHEYGFVAIDGKAKGKTLRLKDLFMICWGEFKGGLLFDAGGPQGAPAFVLKVDADDNLYARSGPKKRDWRFVGRLVKI